MAPATGYIHLLLGHQSSPSNCIISSGSKKLANMRGGEGKKKDGEGEEQEEGGTVNGEE